MRTSSDVQRSNPSTRYTLFLLTRAVITSSPTVNDLLLSFTETLFFFLSPASLRRRCSRLLGICPTYYKRELERGWVLTARSSRLSFP